MMTKILNMIAVHMLVVVLAVQTFTTGTQLDTYYNTQNSNNKNERSLQLFSNDTVLRINCGVPKDVIVTDPFNNKWISDVDYATGPSRVYDLCAALGTSVLDTALDIIYCSQRFFDGAGGYKIPNVPAGQYSVTLMVSELAFKNNSLRVFNISLQGTQIVTNLDIYKTVGFLKAYNVTNTITIPAPTGTIEIDMKASVNNPTLDGIYIVRTGPTQAPVTVPIAITPAKPPTKAPITNVVVPLQMPIRINAGVMNSTASFTDSLGRVWSPDMYYTGGTAFGITSNCTQFGIDALLYCTERYGLSTYTFPVRPNQRYSINIYFAEIIYEKAGIRKFNVTVNGRFVAQNLDLYATSGFRKAYILPVRRIRITASSPTIVIKFLNVMENAKVSGIEIVRSRIGPSPVVIPKAPTSAPVKAPTKKPTKAPTKKPTLAPVKAPTRAPKLNILPAGPVVGRLSAPLRINAGATENWTPPGQSRVVWLSDRYFAGGTAYSTSTVGSVSCNNEIAGTVLDPLFCTERFFSGGSNITGSVSGKYVLPMMSGLYNVKLLFAETFYKDPKERIFNVKVQGEVVTQSLDLIQVAGRNNAVQLSRSVTVNATDPGITIEFSASAENPKINAIQITNLAVGTTIALTDLEI